MTARAVLGARWVARTGGGRHPALRTLDTLEVFHRWFPDSQAMPLVRRLRIQVELILEENARLRSRGSR